MLGFFLVSSKNQVLLLEGDSEFKIHLWQRVEREIRGQIETSTSSGIGTDLMTEPVVIRKHSKRHATGLFSLTEVSHLLLPLVSFYRGLGALGDQLLSIGAFDGNISFKELSNGFLIVNIGNSDDSPHILNGYNRLLNVFIGPLIDLIDSDFSTIRPGKENVLSSLSSYFRGNHQLRYAKTLEIRKTSFYKNSITRIFPLFKSICTQLQLFIGNNRCLLLNGEKIIATANSTGIEKALTKCMDTEDMDCLMKSIVSLQANKKHDMSLHWLRSKNGVVPFYVNVFSYRLTESLVLVCISPSKVDRFLRLVVLILMQINQLTPGSDVERITKDITESVVELANHLNDFVSQIKENQPDSSFLRNPVKSAQFFKSVWSRLSAELLRNTSQPPPSLNGKLLKRFSLSSLKTAISALSLSNSSVSMKNNNGKHGLDLSVKLDVLLAHWRRQIVTLLQELCAISRKDAIQYKVPLFLDSMKRILKPNHEKLFLSSPIGSPAEESKFKNFLRPVDLKMDMLAFDVCNTEKNLSISFESDVIQKEVENWKNMASEGSFCIDIKGTSGQIYTIYKITTKSQKEDKKMSLLRGFVGSTPVSQELPSGSSVTVVFNAFVHKELAWKQLTALSKLVFLELQEASTFFQ